MRGQYFWVPHVRYQTRYVAVSNYSVTVQFDNDRLILEPHHIWPKGGVISKDLWAGRQASFSITMKKPFSTFWHDGTHLLFYLQFEYFIFSSARHFLSIRTPIHCVNLQHPGETKGLNQNVSPFLSCTQFYQASTKWDPVRMGGLADTSLFNTTFMLFYTKVLSCILIFPEVPPDPLPPPYCTDTRFTETFDHVPKFYTSKPSFTSMLPFWDANIVFFMVKVHLQGHIILITARDTWYSELFNGGCGWILVTY